MAYTDEQKQLALSAYAACRNNATQAAKFCREHYDLHVSQEQVLRWAKGEYVAPEIVSNAELLNKPLADRLEDLAHKITDKMFETMGDATFSQLSFALNGAVDKMLVLRGQANQITGQAISKEEAALRIAEIIAKYGSQP